MSWVPSLRDLEMLVAIAEEGSLTAAASRLDISLNAVSRRLSRLEASVEILLVRRTTRTCALTEPAQALVRRSRRVLEQLELAAAELAGHRASPHGTVRVQLPAEVVSEAMLARLRALFALHSELRVKLFATRRDAPPGGDVDVALFVGAPPDVSGWVARRVPQLRWVLCATPDYLARHPPPDTPGDLLDHDCLRYRVHGSEEWPLVHADGSQVRIAVSGSFESDDGRVLHDAVRAGLGIGVRPDREVATSTHVRPVLPGWEFVPPRAYLVGPRGRMQMPAVRIVADAIETAVADLQS